VDLIQQSLYHIGRNEKRSLLIDLLSDKDIKTALVFTRTKHGADKVTKDLVRAGISAGAIHGNKSQNARQLTLHNFKTGNIRVLVATDIAARGIDIDGMTHVFNYELPNIPETYVHRIGRTGRAGASGIAISFCEQEEREFLRDIQKLIRKDIPVIRGHAYENAVIQTRPTTFSRPSMPIEGRNRYAGRNRERNFSKQRA
jgi:ATP-dependent RNA helicase RhlE